mmetsp:Transcript_21733/g.66884  ORF Transcript_21733/g.66884 Transcript_21733/m.66884 type:complete len:274 (+) Transcript_21733:987-1808(+)
MYGHAFVDNESGGGRRFARATAQNPAMDPNFDREKAAALVARCSRLDLLDFEAALDDMCSLCFLQPQRAFRQAYYRKQTKNAWARDDPAFCVVQVGFIMVAATAYGVALGARHPLAFAWIWMLAVLLHWLVGGVAAATATAGFANGALVERGRNDRVEWLYAFDVHCNAFFAAFLVGSVGLYLLLPVALGHSYLAMAVANSVYLVAAAAYFYVMHLGFRALPFLHSTECFLYPVVALMGCLLVSLVLGAFGLKVNVLRILVMGLLGARPSVLE